MAVAHSFGFLMVPEDPLFLVSAHNRHVTFRPFGANITESAPKFGPACSGSKGRPEPPFD